VIAGNVRVDRRPLATGDVFPSGAEVSSEEGASLRVGRAEVALGVGARVSWSEEAGTLTLASGAVDLEVEPANGVALRVVTRRFIVEVVGTSFHVDEEGVRVARGVVRVLDRDRGELLARLGAGEAWRVDGAGERERPAAIEASRDEPPARVSGRRVAPPGDPEAVLEEGRHALARGDVGAAEAAARTVLATRAADRHAAEAEILLAECEQVSGRPDAAARRYLGISERYPNVAAAESALFAAARLRANAGDSDGARALLRAYLERYPSGRFERDVAARLSVLERSQP
jgi:tetratricopeptide (TPR) repeat protein